MEYNPMWANEPYKSGVILPFFWNEDENQGYYLWGKDVQKEGKSVGINNWSGFGGFRELNETCPAETAIREGVEESIGLLANLALSIRNKRTIEFRHDKTHVYVVNLYPKNEEDRCYTIEQINAFHTSFNDLHRQELKNDQKEKMQIGWMKASDIAQKIFNYPPRYTLFEQPCSTSVKLEENAFMRKCQHNFFIDVNTNIPNGLNNIKNGWSGLEGQVFDLPYDRKRGQWNNNNNLNVQNNMVTKPKPWDNTPANKNLNTGSEINNNSLEVSMVRKPKPWDNTPANRSFNWRSENPTSSLEVKAWDIPQKENRK